MKKTLIILGVGSCFTFSSQASFLNPIFEGAYKLQENEHNTRNCKKFYGNKSINVSSSEENRFIDISNVNDFTRINQGRFGDRKYYTETVFNGTFLRYTEMNCLSGSCEESYRYATFKQTSDKVTVTYEYGRQLSAFAKCTFEKASQ